MAMSEEWKARSLAERREIKAIVQAEGIKPENSDGHHWCDWYAAFYLDDCGGDIAAAKAMLVGKIRENKADFQEREQRWQQERETRAEEKRQRIEQRKVKREAAIKHIVMTGEPIPEDDRPKSGRCMNCLRELTDPESIRLGIGPRCLETIAVMQGLDTALVRKALRGYGQSSYPGHEEEEQ